MNTLHACVDAAQFREALSNVLRFSVKRSKTDILGEALARFENERCSIICTNLTQWCEGVVPYSGDTFSFVFSDTKSILSACRFFCGQLDITYTINPSEGNPISKGEVIISDGKRSLRHGIGCPSDFPTFPTWEKMRRYVIDAEKLHERFKRVKYALSESDSRPARCCVEFCQDKIIAVDGFRLAMSTDPSLVVERPFFIPPAAMSELQMFKGHDCTLSVGEEWASFENESLQLLTRIPPNDGLDIESAIPTSFETEYTAPVDYLWDEVKYINGFVNQRTRKPLRFDGKALVLETPEGVYSSEIDLPPVCVRGFNPRYLLEGLGQFKCKKAKSIIMKMGLPHAPLVMTDGENDLAMILPVRLDVA